MMLYVVMISDGSDAKWSEELHNRLRSSDQKASMSNFHHACDLTVSYTSDACLKSTVARTRP